VDGHSPQDWRNYFKYQQRKSGPLPRLEAVNIYVVKETIASMSGLTEQKGGLWAGE
jgi:hypothetical protein